MLEQTAQSSEQCNKEKQKLLEACFADNSRIEDQRGLLSKDDFEIPNFLEANIVNLSVSKLDKS